jgi:hypothetical protein
VWVQPCIHQDPTPAIEVLFILFLPLGKRNSLSEIQQKNPVIPDSCVSSVVWHFGWHELELLDPK